MKTYNYDPEKSFLDASTLTKAVEQSPFMMTKGLYDWMISHFHIKADCFAAATLFQAGFVAGVRAERERRHENEKAARS